VTGPFFLTNLTVYVDANPLIGNDSTGQVEVRALPFRTISAALAQAALAVTPAAEYHVQIMPGTYPEVIVWPTVFTHSLSIQAYDVDPVIIPLGQIITTAASDGLLTLQALTFQSSVVFVAGTCEVTMTNCSVDGGIRVTTPLAALNLTGGFVANNDDAPVVTLNTGGPQTAFFATGMLFNGSTYTTNLSAIEADGPVLTQVTSCTFQNFIWANTTGIAALYTLNNPSGGPTAPDDTTFSLNTISIQADTIPFTLLSETSSFPGHLATVTRNAIGGALLSAARTAAFIYYTSPLAAAANTANAVFSYNVNTTSVPSGFVILTDMPAGTGVSTLQFRHNEHPLASQIQAGVNVGSLPVILDINDQDGAGAVVSNTGTGGNVKEIDDGMYTFEMTDSVVFFSVTPPIFPIILPGNKTPIGKDLHFSASVIIGPQPWTFNDAVAGTILATATPALSVSLRNDGDAGWYLWEATLPPPVVATPAASGLQQTPQTLLSGGPLLFPATSATSPSIVFVSAGPVTNVTLNPVGKYAVTVELDGVETGVTPPFTLRATLLTPNVTPVPVNYLVPVSSLITAAGPPVVFSQVFSSTFTYLLTTTDTAQVFGLSLIFSAGSITVNQVSVTVTYLGPNV